MGRGCGAAEHDEDTRVAAMDDPKAILDKKRRVTDDDDSEDEGDSNALIEKAPEQIAQEREQAWRAYEYPAWCHHAVYLIFACCMVNQVLTLTQYHGTHSSRQPVDFLPLDLRQGGWENNTFRYAGAVLGLIASCFSFVLSPSTSKFKWMFLILFVGSIMHFFSFGHDLFDLNEAARNLEEVCDQDNSVSARKFVCDQDRFRATVIFDMVCGVVGVFVSFFILYQAVTGVVKKRKVFNDQTKSWEKIVLGPEEEYHVAFPKRFIKQRNLFLGSVVFCALLNVTSLVLSITQMTLDLYQTHDMKTPIMNTHKNIPMDIYTIRTMEAIPGVLGVGGWPVPNFLVRLFTNLLALIAAAFLIQWRRDGRKEQLWVMIFLLISACGYIVAIVQDQQSLTETEEDCSYAKPLNMGCNFMKYHATLIFDWLCFGFIVAFVVAAFRKWVQLAQPGREGFDREYGWWCFGEWAHEKRIAAEQADMNSVEA